MKREYLLNSVLTAIIGIAGYILIWMIYEWKLVFCILLIHWSINCERNDYINKIFRKEHK